MTSLWSLWQDTAARCAEKPVVIDADTGRAWTATQLTAEAEHVATMFRGPYVPICQPNGALWLATFLAIQKIDAAAVPLDVSLPPEIQRETIRRLGPRSKSPVCCVKLTSGTTGDLKHILCSAPNLRADGEHIIHTMGLLPADRNLAIIPLGHSYGLGNLVMPLLLQGTAVVCAQAFVPRQILRLIKEHQVTVLPTVPAILRALAQLEGAIKPPSLRLVISAGAPLSAEVARQFHQRYGIKIHNFYGSSETGGICYDRNGNATLKGRSVGKPLVGVKVRIRRDGRVAVSSPAGNATLPDLGEWNRYGELRLLGRVGEVANVGGKKVAPAEIERALRELRGISDAWVAVLQDKRGNDYLAAAVETKRPRPDIEQELLHSLSAWKLPKTWILAPALPRTDRGKLHTAELRARLSVNLP
ncbi:MAG TPA: fatty acid--CoA ligase family protein [Verrucomicrobiae bacterium]|nr:fatty acid--CoA ligase family protein [Verrucomicrobiae bacterium]